MVPNSSSQDYPIQPVSFIKVQKNDDFWSKRINIHRKITLPYVLRKCETTRRIANFSRAFLTEKIKENKGYFIRGRSPYKNMLRA